MPSDKGQGTGMGTFARDRGLRRGVVVLVLLCAAVPAAAAELEAPRLEPVATGSSPLPVDPAPAVGGAVDGVTAPVGPALSEAERILEDTTAPIREVAEPALVNPVDPARADTAEPSRGPSGSAPAPSGAGAPAAPPTSPSTGPPADDGSPAPSSSAVGESPGSSPGRESSGAGAPPRPAVVQAASDFSLPLGMAGLVVAFLLVQSRLDRRDPKLLAASTSRGDALPFS
jgi:hypothetical protein